MKKLILCPIPNISPSIRLSDKGSCHDMIWENGHVLDSQKYDFSRLDFVLERSNAKAMTDYAVTDMGCSIISECLKHFFKKNGIDNIQYYPATVVGNDNKKTEENYYAANIIGLVDCIDRENSEMDAEEDGDGELNIIYSIEKLVLKDLDSHGSLYRAYPFTRIILIDEVFKERLKLANITGIHLVDPSRWDGFNGEK